MTPRLFEAHIDVSNLEESMHFYGQLPGLELGMKEEGRRIAFYFIGGWNASMLGLWEKPADQVRPQHFAIELDRPGLDAAIADLHTKGIPTKNFAGEETGAPFVFGWMPAAAIYFADPDGHLLEYIAPLPGPPRPEAGILSWPEWQALS
ncbi:MAG: VOC family protein [Candidatus Hydrogenedentes bacterium]|nr:VOC family protein [Candidatus Hydrogenedentota bacterium]